MESIIENYSYATSAKINYTNVDDPYWDIFLDDRLDDENIEFIEGEDYASHNDVVNLSSNIQENKLIGLKVQLPHHGDRMKWTVLKRQRNSDGQLAGNEVKFPALDRREYFVDLGDGNYAKYAANILMENLYDQIDDDGRTSKILMF